MLEVDSLSIFVAPNFEERHYLTAGPTPSARRSQRPWAIGIGRWEPVGPLDENGDGSFSGSSVLTCVLPARPTPREIMSLVNLATEEPGRLEIWSKTRIGEKLSGTNFLVTENRSRGDAEKFRKAIADHRDARERFAVEECRLVTLEELLSVLCPREGWLAQQCAEDRIGAVGMA
jgi:hypothetical protein